MLTQLVMSAVALRRKLLSSSIAAQGDILAHSSISTSKPVDSSDVGLVDIRLDEQLEPELGQIEVTYTALEPKEVDRTVRPENHNHYSSFKPTKQKLRRKSNGTTVLRLSEGEVSHESNKRADPFL